MTLPVPSVPPSPASDDRDARPDLLTRWLRRLSPLPPTPIVYRCDLDKTYLATRFESLRGLARIPFEKAEDKRTLPGAISLIRGLRSSADRMQRPSSLYFLSASPPQIGDAIRGKLALDGIRYDGILFKDQLRNIMRGRFRNLREQVGYKLVALLQSRSGLDDGRPEVLFGDDWESDPLIYSLYADILCGRLEAGALRALLVSVEVDRDLLTEATRLTEAIRPSPVVWRIFINLERRTAPLALAAFGSRLVPTFNYLQTAAALYEMGLLEVDVVVDVARELIAAAGYSSQGLANSLADLQRRGHLAAETARLLQNRLAESSLAPTIRLGRWQHWRERVATARRRRSFQPSDNGTIDYQNLLHLWSSGRRSSAPAEEGPSHAEPESEPDDKEP